MYSDNIVMCGRLSCHVAGNSSLDFLQTRLLVIVFKAGSVDVINECLSIVPIVIWTIY